MNAFVCLSFEPIRLHRHAYVHGLCFCRMLPPLVVLVCCFQSLSNAQRSPVCQVGTSEEHCCSYSISITNMRGSPLPHQAMFALGTYTMLGEGMHDQRSSSAGRPVYIKASDSNSGRFLFYSPGYFACWHSAFWRAPPGNWSEAT